MTMLRNEPHAERGFSLVELMVAMVITMIISGAIYGLLSSGQSAFRREPELTDRQQNIRVAMDLVMSDLRTAGSGFPAVTQVFTVGLNGAGPQGLSSLSDYLEFIGDDGTCPPVTAAGSSGANIDAAGKIPGCYGTNPGLVFVLFQSDPPGIGFGHNNHSSGTKLNFPGGKNAPSCAACTVATPFSGGALEPTGFARLQMFRYEIALDGTGAAAVPTLYRSDTGGIDPVAMTFAHAGAGVPGWQAVARGIEDLQVQYRLGNSSTTWADAPGTVSGATDYGNMVREVRVTLSARVVTPNLTTAGAAATAGAITTGAGITGGRAVRGSLTSVTSPRAVLSILNAASPSPWN
jgi:prepilin-type N-terminal cleavage/methylation domain-containing protein